MSHEQTIALTPAQQEAERRLARTAGIQASIDRHRAEAGEPGPDETAANPAVGLAIRLTRLHGFETAIPALAALGDVTVQDVRLLAAIKRVIAVAEGKSAAELLPEPPPDRARDRLVTFLVDDEMRGARAALHALPAEIKAAAPRLTEAEVESIAGLARDRLYAVLRAISDAEARVELDEARAAFLVSRLRGAGLPRKRAARPVIAPAHRPHYPSKRLVL